MARIFHLNMRQFGSGNVNRINGFAQAFADIQRAGLPDFIVAGFTEVRASNLGFRWVLSGLAQQLDPGLTGLLVIDVGTTALGTREYIGIAWDPVFVTMQHAGCVIWNSMRRAWQAYNVPAAAMVNHRIRLPAGLPLGADTRGLAYIAATYRGRNFLFGFMHNMYRLGSRYVVYTSLPTMAERARQAIGAPYGNAEVIIGGDFNLRPRPPITPRGAALVLHERAAMSRRGYVNTTATNPYDFWVVSDPNIGHQFVSVHRRTRSPLLSDHAAITLYY